MSDWTVPGYADLRQPPDLGGAVRVPPAGSAPASSARVVLARHAASGVDVTITYLDDTFRLDEEYLGRYRAHARLVAEVDSVYVAQLYEYVESADGVAVIGEYVPGVTLRELLAHGPLRPEAALTVLKGLVTGLRAALPAGPMAVTADDVLVDPTGHPRLRLAVNPAPAAAPSNDGIDLDDGAFAVFVESVTGAAPGSPNHAVARLPKRLRALAAVAHDRTTLLTRLDAVARTAVGEDWEERGRRRLADQVRRARRRGRA